MGVYLNICYESRIVTTDAKSVFNSDLEPPFFNILKSFCYNHLSVLTQINGLAILLPFLFQSMWSSQVCIHRPFNFGQIPATN